MLKNTEGNTEFDISDSLMSFSSSGVCAMMRLKDEEEFIVPCLLAVKDFFDEFVVVYNDTQDKTRELVKAVGLPNLHTYEYPFELAFRGNDHTQIPVNSLYHAAYYYNWCLSKVRSEWVAKWDGDNIALPNFQDTRRLIDVDLYDSVINCGWDLAGPKMKMLGSQQQVGYETRLFRKGQGVKYQRNSNGFCEALSPSCNSAKQPIPTFLHLKWSKQNPTEYWPIDWIKSPHFRNIADKHRPVTPYMGQYPQVLIDYILIGKDPYKLIDLYRSGRNPSLAVNYEGEPCA